MLRIIIPFALGIVLHIFYPLSVSIFFAVFLLFLFVQALFVFVRKFYAAYKWRWVFGVFSFLSFMVIGAMLVELFSENKRPLFFADQIGNSSGYVIRITEPLHQKVKTLKAIGEIQAICVNNKLVPATGKVMLYFEKSDNAYRLNYGNIIYTECWPSEIQPPQNPSEFNYKRFLGFHGIYHQFYLSESKWINTPISQVNPLWDIAYKTQARFVAQIKENIPTQNEFAVCSALLIGYEDYLDQELIDAYSSSGALHVLSVSGLHVGIIYIFLGWLLKFMDKRKWAFAIKNILLILLIWFYALLAGLAPSILRSAVMITMLIVGRWINKQGYMLNTTLCSAFVLLNTNPFMITEVGFQLSYLAVFGIVYLHQRLVRIFTVYNPIGNWIWQLISVSVCAQLMTFPLGLLYFHQFPNLFLVSNLMVIPVSTLLMYSSIIATVFAPWQFVSTIFWKTSYFLTLFMNKTVFVIDQMPHAIVRGISITITETWTIYIIIAFGLWFLMYKSRNAFFTFLILLCAFTGWQLCENYFLSQQQKIIVYNVKNKTAIDLVSGTSHRFIADNELAIDKSKIRFHIEHNWFDMGIKNTEHISFFQTDTSADSNSETEFLSWNNQVIFVPQQWLPRLKQNSKVKVDYMIITSRFKNKIETALKIVEPRKIIFDSSIALRKRITMEKELKKSGIDYYSVAEQGAFIEGM